MQTTKKLKELLTKHMTGNRDNNSPSQNVRKM